MNLHSISFKVQLLDSYLDPSNLDIYWLWKHPFSFTLRHRHKLLKPACPGKWIFEKRAFGQVHFCFHLPEWASWFSEHLAYLFYSKWPRYPELCKQCNKTEKKMFFTNPWWTIHAFLAYIISYFRQVKNYVGQVKIIYYLPVKLAS